MTWPTIARKEFEDALGSRMLWAIVAVIALMTSLSAGLAVLVPELQGDATTAVGGASQFAGLLVPIMALIASYLAVAGERESGSLKVLLGLPPSRAEVVVGKCLGRGAVVVVGIVLGFAVAGVVTAAIYGSLPLLAFARVTALTALLGVAFVGVGVGISSVTGTRARAMTLAVAAYLGLTLVWDLVPTGIHAAVTGSMPGATVPAWYVLVTGLSPTGAYDTLVQYTLLGDAAVVARLGGGPVPVYLNPVVFLVILAAWTAVPVVAGYAVFRRADLS